MATIKETFKYLWKQWKRLFNVYWILIPIWGWFVQYGYLLRIITSILKKKNKELPTVRPFKGLFAEGFFYFILMIVWNIIIFVMLLIPYAGWIAYFYFLIIAPVLVIRFAISKKIKDGFNIVYASKVVFNNFGSWVITVLKIVAVVLILLVASIPLVTLIITLPMIVYGPLYLWSEWYTKAKK